MAKVKRIPLGLEPGQQRIELPDRVSVELASLADTVREGLLAFAVGVGMQVFRTMLEEDVTVVAGPKGRHDPAGRVAYRHGDQESSVVLGGRKVAVSRPRVRGVAGGEVALPVWEAFAGEELLADQTMASLLAGISTRSYDKTLEPVGSLEASATSRSAVSRRFVARTAKALDELMARDLSDLRICALFADGICESEHMMVCAIGIDTQGRKHLLGLREGTTENRAVCAGLLSDLVGRGLDFSGGILAVLDGGKGLRAAVKEVFGNLGLVQRCRAHKRRNVLDHLPKETQPVVQRRLEAAWAKDTPALALASLKALATWLEADHPGAAASLREGMEETITLNHLDLPPLLIRTLATTNPIESAYSVTRPVMGKVKRWRDGAMVVRWTAAGMEVAAGKFRRIKGYRELPILIEKLAGIAEHFTQQSGKVA
jgi:transposase-like protein